MEPIMVYFESIPSRDRSLILAGGIAFFWLMETAFPLFKFSYKKWKHAAINVFFTLTTIIVNFALAFLLLQISRWTQESHWGLLTFIDSIPLILYALAGLMGLDLISAYFIHWLEHKVRFMWRFHLIHHTDVHVDTTTANRHHPGESIFRFIFTSLAVFILGAPIWLIMLYQALSVVLSQFNHANISLPERVDKFLSLALVTPNMHHVHHHYVLPQTDTNYGNIFSIWDRMFGTFSYMKQEDIKYGIDTHLDASEHSKISKMLKIPFEQYRKPVGGKFSSPE
ncbi:MAG: sterol desaturase family protein [Saprospiraceae bacterium]|jgi:sterol desaturase/sphingolipid hydroxylase (fatty acid hydroxylase superfamily)